MITDSFDNQTKTLICLEDFYGERGYAADACLLVFSRSLYDELLRRFPCRTVGEIGSVNGRTPIWCCTRTSARFSVRSEEYIWQKEN